MPGWVRSTLPSPTFSPLINSVTVPVPLSGTQGAAGSGGGLGDGFLVGFREVCEEGAGVFGEPAGFQGDHGEPILHFESLLISIIALINQPSEVRVSGQ